MKRALERVFAVGLELLRHCGRQGEENYQTPQLSVELGKHAGPDGRCADYHEGIKAFLEKRPPKF